MADEQTIYFEVDREYSVETRGTSGTREDNVAFMRSVQRTDGAILRVLNTLGGDITAEYTDDLS